MPVEPFELLKLIVGLLILTIPGYLWSYLFSKQLTYLERMLFGFLCGLAFFIISTFALNSLFQITITQTIVLLLFLVYFLSAVLITLLMFRTYTIQKIHLTWFKNKTNLILLSILGFSFLMTLLPHLANNYYLPFHVDEWIHWSYTRTIIEQGATSFLNPYTGSGIIFNPELGFHLASANIQWISASSLETIFLFMPAILGVLVSLTAFFIGNRSPRKFGLEAAFLVALIPTTVRTLGPSFYTPSTLSLLFLVFLVWLAQRNTLKSILLLSIFLFNLFLIHPVAALASIGILLVYAVFLSFEKHYRSALLIAGLTVLPIILVVVFTSRWNILIDWFVSSTAGQQYLLDYNLPKIQLSVTQLGLLTWGLLFIGVYYSFIKGHALHRALSIAAIAFVIVIGLYDKFTYGFPYVYERLFLYLFLLVTLIAGFALAELRRTLLTLTEKKRFPLLTQKIKHTHLIIPLLLGIIILLIAVPTHLTTPYYKMITEQDFDTFTWIHDHINDYRDTNHSYTTAAVDPFKASPFSAVTGLYIFSSSMHPLVRYNLHTQIETFLKENCVDTSFLDTYHLSVIYGDAINTDLTKIYDRVYLYPGLSEE